jgi:hypothetical protein
VQRCVSLSILCAYTFLLAGALLLQLCRVPAYASATLYYLCVVLVLSGQAAVQSFCGQSRNEDIPKIATVRLQIICKVRLVVRWRPAHPAFQDERKTGENAAELGYCSTVYGKCGRLGPQLT